MNKKSFDYYGEFLIVLSGMLFGTMPFFSKLLYGMGANVYALALIRFGAGSLFLFCVLRIQGHESLAVGRAQLRELAWLSVPFAAVSLLLWSSYNYISSGLATTLHFCYPVVVILIEVFGFKAAASRRIIVCCLLCVVGILLFYEPDGSMNLPGMGMALLSGILYAVYVVYLNRGSLRGMAVMKKSAWLSGITAAGIAVIFGLSGQLAVKMPWTGWLLSIFSAVCVATAALVAFQRGVGLCGPQKATLLSTTEPVTSVLLGIAVMRETMSWKTAVGMVCILLSTVLLVADGKDR